MTLAAAFARRISAQGPMTIADFMHAALTDPAHGYYTTRDPLGRGGDFITAPEISQMFGELIGLALAQAWRDQGAPHRFALVELGPGRGTLMADALRATRGVAGFHPSFDLHFVEVSPALRAAQAKSHPAAQWHDSIATLPETPLFLIANEFFDALPIRQFVRDGPGWRERVVGLRDGALAFGLTDGAARPDLEHRLADTADGDLIETCAPAAAIAADIGRRIAAHGGCALIVDYGDWRSLGDTLQAVRGHAKADVLAEPGTADLTAHVDFEALAIAAAPARHTRLTPQGAFLERLGITARAEALAQRLTADPLDSHIAAHRRLTHPTQMGHIFKVLALYPDGAPVPPGLAP